MPKQVVDGKSPFFSSIGSVLLDICKDCIATLVGNACYNPSLAVHLVSIVVEAINDVYMIRKKSQCSNQFNLQWF